MARKNIEPCNILAVTFTKKAANEMIERLNVLIGKDQTSQLLIGTFHSICNKLLRAFGGKVGLKGGFVIIDTNERYSQRKAASVIYLDILFLVRKS